MATTPVSTKTLTSDAYADIPPQHDGRPFHNPPEGWQPENRPPVSAVEGASQADYDAAIRTQLLSRETFWRRYAHHVGFRKFIKDKSEAERALIDAAFQLDLKGSAPTLDDCIPKNSILEAVDRYFWEYTDMPRELPFFYVMHYVLASLMQRGVEIHKGCGQWPKSGTARHNPSTQTYKNIYTLTMKDLEFRGSSLSDLRDFPQTAMRDAGHQLDKVQHGLAPDDAKPMPTIGAGVVELRIWDEAGTFRVVYVAKFEDAVYVLHCFKKKTTQTSQPDIELARKRFKELVKEISK